MIENDEQKPSLDFLVHHGVAGMKWGVRKEAPAPVTPLRNVDVKEYGTKGATRIARNRDSGLTVSQARQKEINRRRMKTRAAVGAIIVGRLLAIHRDSISSAVSKKTGFITETVLKKADANRARNSVTALAKDAAKINYAKKNLGGAYKIHTM